jgi:hypothetical protein
MKWVVIIITVLSVAVAIFPIVFEDALKLKKKNEPKPKRFKPQFSNVNRYSIGFIIMICTLNCLNGLISYKSIDENDNKQEAIKQEKENIFTHLQNEIDNNLQVITFEYDSIIVKKLIKSNLFTSHKLSSLYLTKYGLISQNKDVISWFIRTAEAINSVNYKIDQINTITLTPEIKKFEIENFLQRVSTAKKYLVPIYERVYKLNSYVKYEPIDFTDSLPRITEDSLRIYLVNSALNRPDVDSISFTDGSPSISKDSLIKRYRTHSNRYAK